MKRWITKICEPKRLLLAWQSPDLQGNRTRFSVGEILQGDGNSLILRYFPAPQVASAVEQGYVGYPAFSIEKQEHSAGVREALLRRLPPRSRSDFSDYKAHFGLSSETVLSDLALLAYTEAKLPSDGFSLVNPLDGVDGPCQFIFEVAGYRHYASELKSPLCAGTLLTFVPEPHNPKDPKAVRIEADGECVGYVNRLQTEAFHRWIKRNAVRGYVDRVNGTADRPRLLMFVDVEAVESSKAA